VCHKFLLPFIRTDVICAKHRNPATSKDPMKTLLESNQVPFINFPFTGSLQCKLINFFRSCSDIPSRLKSNAVSNKIISLLCTLMEPKLFWHVLTANYVKRKIFGNSDSLNDLGLHRTENKLFFVLLSAFQKALFLAWKIKRVPTEHMQVPCTHRMCKSITHT